MKKGKNFEDYLKNFNSIAGSLKTIQTLVEITAGQKIFAKDELIQAMKQKLIDRCSLEFLREMDKEVSKKIKNNNLFSPGQKSNLDYLVEVIFFPLTQSPHVIGLEHFLAPGENYESSFNFCQKFFKDFIEVGELLGVCPRECSDVKIGYAIEFYKP